MSTHSTTNQQLRLHKHQENLEVINEVNNEISSIHNGLIEGARVVMVKPEAPKGVNINFLPLYGNYAKSSLQKVEDELFLADCDKNFKNRRDASRFFSKIAWEYLAEGGKDLATHRFNLAYLLDSNNEDLYWGLGVVAYQKGKYHEAIDLLQMGISLSSEGQENPIMLVDLASIYIKCFEGHQESSELSKAYELLHKALDLKPSYANAYMQLSLAHLAENKMQRAWSHFHKGYKINPKGADKSVLNALLTRSNDPLGVFHKP